MTRLFPPLLVFVGGSFVGPILYWAMPMMPRPDLLYYGVGPLIWPALLIAPIADALGTASYALVFGLNIVLYAIVGAGIVLATRDRRLFILAGILLESGVVILALAAVRFRFQDLFGHDGTMLIALLIALAFYGALVLLVRRVARRYSPQME